MQTPRVLVIYNEPVLPKDHPDAAAEFDVIDSSQTVVKILEEASFPVRQLGFAHDPRPLLDELRDHPPDVVFNLFEGLATQTATEISVVGLLEWLNVPFTGSPSLAIALGRDKIRTKYLLQGAGVPTARFVVVERLPAPAWPFGWPAIVKPALQDCSVGIEQASVVSDPTAAAERIALMLERFGPPVLVEEFIFGRELHVNLIEEPSENSIAPRLVHVPFCEIRFSQPADRGVWPIYSYDAKWNVESTEFQNTPLENVVALAPEVAEPLRRVAEQTWHLVGLRDCGRIDFRLTPDNKPYVLEANPNPYLHGEGLIDGLNAIGRSHPQFITGMVWLAFARGSRKADS